MEFKGRITEIIERDSAYHVKYKTDNGVNAFSLNKSELCGRFSEACMGKKVTVETDNHNVVKQVMVGWTTVLRR